MVHGLSLSLAGDTDLGLGQGSKKQFNYKTTEKEGRGQDKKLFSQDTPYALFLPLCPTFLHSKPHHMLSDYRSINRLIHL